MLIGEIVCMLYSLTCLEYLTPYLKLLMKKLSELKNLKLMMNNLIGLSWPQMSAKVVLGPLMFNLYLNDFKDNIDSKS